MIYEPVGILAILLFIEGTIFYFAENENTKKFFNILPPMFWIYFLPMMATTLNILPQNTDVYKFISTNFLPSSLVLLLLSVNLPAILKLGKTALIMMLSGSLGIIIGGPIVLLLFKRWLPENIWLGFGALSGSWIGGSANMLAVKEGIGTPDNIFFPMVVVDTIVAYSWMGIVIFLAGYQKLYDKWNKSNTAVIDKLNKTLADEQVKVQPITLKYVSLIFAVAFLGTFISSRLAQKLPEIKNVISTYTWTIILASTIGIILSFTKVKKLEIVGASKIGFWMLYFVLASIGARASFKDITSAPVLIIAGFLWILIHATVLFFTSRITKSPMFLIATASQANVGGPASAPVVAAVYQPSLAPVGLLMAVLGNIIGTYCGIICAQLCRLVSGQ